MGIKQENNYYDKKNVSAPLSLFHPIGYDDQFYRWRSLINVRMRYIFWQRWRTANQTVHDKTKHCVKISMYSWLRMKCLLSTQWNYFLKHFMFKMFLIYIFLTSRNLFLDENSQILNDILVVGAIWTVEFGLGSSVVEILTWVAGVLCLIPVQWQAHSSFPITAILYMYLLKSR